MPASLANINSTTPMGANLTGEGATFRVWAPNALAVYVTGDFTSADPEDSNLLTQIGKGHWAGYLPNVKNRDNYMFYVKGTASQGYKRDPYARELALPFPGKCIVRDPSFPWHETGYVTPKFEDFVIYQLHVGVFYVPRFPLKGTFLDVVSKIPYLKDLGVTILQLLPIQEYSTQFSLGYNNLDFYSPETEFAVEGKDLEVYLNSTNELLINRGLKPYTLADISGEMNQLKVLVDLCHVYGLGVIFDQVYNHGGGGWDDACLKNFDRQLEVDSNAQYFIPGDFAGGLIFDFSKPDVRQFLINNAKYFLDEYRVDGYRYDEVSTIDSRGQPNGWSFCQDLTGTLKFLHPSAINHAEYWSVNPLVVEDAPHGAGFHTTLTDGLRISIRNVIANASQPDDRQLDMDSLAASLWPNNFYENWKFVQGPENHDRVHVEREQRVARLSDPSNSRSWYASSRSRVATGLCMTAPGIPMLFMGQEFLEDKQWSEDYSYWPNQFIYWGGLEVPDKKMTDFLRFTREIINLRWQYRALRSKGFAITHTNNANRVLVFHRWIPGQGDDVLVVVHLGNNNRYGYRIGFPVQGQWKEAFNSDVYEDWVNPQKCGNGGQVYTDSQPYDGLEFSCSIAIPANSILVFAKE